MKKFSVFAVAVLALVSVSGVFANSSNVAVNGSINDTVAVDTVVAQPEQTAPQEVAAPAEAQETAVADSVK